MNCLIRCAYLKTAYRGVLEFLSVSPSLRKELGFDEKLPHDTTPQKFSARSKVLEIADTIIRAIGQAAGEPILGEGAAAMDATGLETTTASAHFQTRARWRAAQMDQDLDHRAVWQPFAFGAGAGLGPNNDKCQARELIAEASETTFPAKLYADAGYDAEWIHEQCRDEWGVESVIKPAVHRTDGKRSEISKRYLDEQHYSRRWGVEPFFSGFKRTKGSMLTSRKPHFRVPAYTLRR